jgi:CDP-diacylglycerol--glycerol-3-phosphate 3-phosphatidyltransferase/CDP-diacylglycerol--inositol 3-phosphatidyltransferase
MLDRFKAFWQGVVLAPIVDLLIRLRVSPDVVTLIGTLGVCVGALAFFPRGHLLAGVVFITCFVFSDLIDGAMARKTGRSSSFGAFLDSTLDRTGENLLLAGIAVGCAAASFEIGVGLAALAMAFASVVTYARARAEAVGLRGEVGIAPRPERLVVLSIGLILAGLLGGLPVVASGCSTPTASCVITGKGDPSAATVLAVALAIVAVTSAITVAQRILYVRRQSLEEKEH